MEKFKLGEKVQINQQGELLTSNLHLMGKELTVVNFVNTGLISQPVFVVVSCNGKEEEISPEFITVITGI